MHLPSPPLPSCKSKQSPLLQRSGKSLPIKIKTVVAMVLGGSSERKIGLTISRLIIAEVMIVMTRTGWSDWTTRGVRHA